MKGLVLDIETVDKFDDNKKNPEDLEISVVGIYSYPLQKYEAYVKEEFDKLWEVIRECDTIIGFNSNHFDIPLLNKYTNLDLKKMKSIDLLETVKKSIGRRIKLDWIANGTLGTTKSGSGLDAIKWWSEGDAEKVKKYCLDDVKITKDLFEIAKEKKLLKYKDFGTVHDIQLDTSDWRLEEKTPENSTASLF